MKRKARRLSSTAALPPGTMVHVGPALTQTTKASLLLYDSAAFRQVDSPTPQEMRRLADGAGVAWVRMEGLAQVEAVDQVCQAFGLHPLVREDIVNTSQRPKLDDYGDYAFMALRCLVPQEGDPREWRTEQVSLVLGQGWLLSFQESHTPLLEPVVERLAGGQGRGRSKGADYLAYALVDTVVDAYFAVLEDLDDQTEELQDQLLGAPTKQTLERMHLLKRQALVLRKALWPMREVVNGMERGDNPLFQPGTRVYLRDVYDHTVQIIETAEGLRDMLAGMLDIYLSGVSIRLNEVMKVLTVIATIFMPLTFIAGVYGMNFELMPELKWKWGYPVALLLMAAVAGVMLTYFRRKRWL
jgi:magnesium transporter